MLAKRIAYLGDKLQSFSVDGFGDVIKQPLLIVVARSHYTEQRKSYAAISKQELNQLLKLQRETQQIKPVTQVIENSQIDGFDVITLCFDEHILNALPSHCLLVPETALFINTDEPKIALQLATPQGMLFYAHSPNQRSSSYQKGMLTHFEQFKLSAGVASQTPQESIEAHNYASFLWQQLTRSKLEALWQQSTAFTQTAQTSSAMLHSLYLIPLAGVALFLLAVMGYYEFKHANIESELNTQSQQTLQLLDKKQQAEQVNTSINTVYQQFSTIRRSHPDWQIISVAIDKKMSITRLQKSNNTLKIRGMAAKASDVLSAISKEKRVKSAAFDGAVRKSRGQDLFTLKLELEH